MNNLAPPDAAKMRDKQVFFAQNSILKDVRDSFDLFREQRGLRNE